VDSNINNVKVGTLYNNVLPMCTFQISWAAHQRKVSLSLYLLTLTWANGILVF